MQYRSFTAAIGRKRFRRKCQQARGQHYRCLRAWCTLAAANKHGTKLVHVEAGNPDQFETAFEIAVHGGAEAMLFGPDALFQPVTSHLPDIAARHRLPALYVFDGTVKAGGLISYGVDYGETHRLLGVYAGRILKGANPADLPVEQSTKTILSINLKTAKALGIAVPNSLLVRADQIIE